MPSRLPSSPLPRPHAKRRPRALRFAPTRLRGAVGEGGERRLHIRVCVCVCVHVRRWALSGPNRYRWHRRTAILFHSDCCFLPRPRPLSRAHTFAYSFRERTYLCVCLFFNHRFSKKEFIYVYVFFLFKPHFLKESFSIFCFFFTSSVSKNFEFYKLKNLNDN